MVTGKRGIEMSETKGLYIVPDEHEPPTQGSVSAPVSSMGRADAPLLPCPFCNCAPQLVSWLEYVRVMCPVCGAEQSANTPQEEAIEAWNRRDGEAARVAEAVARERARIVAALKVKRAEAERTAKAAEAQGVSAIGVARLKSAAATWWDAVIEAEDEDAP
jgi:Lar family restriction alleviation protein